MMHLTVNFITSLHTTTHHFHNCTLIYTSTPHNCMSLYKLHISVHHLIYTSTHHNLTVHQSSSLYSILPHFSPVYFNLNHGTFFPPLYKTATHSIVTDSMCLLQTICVCPRKSVFVTESLCFQR